MRRTITSVSLAIALFTGSTAWAVPTLAIDLDALVPGIQSSRTVFVGDSVDVGVVLTGDATFDTVIFDVAFDPTRIVPAPGGGPVAGELAGQAPIASLDVFGGVPLASGDGLTPLDPAATSSLGGVGLTSLALPFMYAGGDVSVAFLTLQALAPGQSVLAPGPVTDPDFVLFLAGNAVDVLVQDAVLTVRDTAEAPEPSAFVLMMAAVLAVVARRRHVR